MVLKVKIAVTFGEDGGGMNEDKACGWAIVGF